MFDVSIRFPNMGIELSNVGNSISIFGFKIAFYGIIIGLGILTGIIVAQIQAKRTGQNPELYLDFALFAVFISVVCARIYYVAFEWDNYKNDILQVFNVRGGGLAIYGGIIGALLTAIVYTRIKKISFWLLADTGCLGLVIGQVIGRWGNFFNREAFGDYTNNFFAMQLKFSEVDKANLTQKIMDNIKVIDDVQYVQVHPTFLYESLWNLCLFILLFVYSKHKKFDGQIILLYLLGYAVGRMWIETLRTDQLIISGINLPASIVVAVIMAVLSVALLVYRGVKEKRATNM